MDLRKVVDWRLQQFRNRRVQLVRRAKAVRAPGGKEPE
jgi:hypothetical protein